ncbi:MAG: MATE family efflux transporter, partial [Alphaproteobacteria bacterium]
MGDVILAANAVLFNMVTFMAYALEGFAGASQAMVGRAVAAGSKADYRGAVHYSSLWALAFAAAFTVAYAVAGSSIVDILTTMTEVRAVAYAALPWMIAAPLVSVWGYQFDGIFIGATRSVEMRDAMIVSLLIYLIATEAFRPLLGNHGIWLGFTVFMIARGVTL